MPSPLPGHHARCPLITKQAPPGIKTPNIIQKSNPPADFEKYTHQLYLGIKMKTWIRDHKGLGSWTFIFLFSLEWTWRRSSRCSSVVMNRTSIHEDTSIIPGLAQWVGSCHELYCRSQTQLQSHITVAVHRPAAAAAIRPLAWEPTFALGVALRKKQNWRKVKSNNNKNSKRERECK